MICISGCPPRNRLAQFEPVAYRQACCPLFPDLMLTASQLCFERHFQPVFRPLDFELDRGEILVITGDNGSGKTTLIRLLAGVLIPSQGQIRCSAESLAYVGHLLAIKDELSVVENLRFMTQFSGSGGTDFDSIVAKAGLQRVSGQLARTLSAGQRKRCALARLLLCPASLWLLDEPYSNLDEHGIALVDQLLGEHQERGGMTVLATHGLHRPAETGHLEIRLQPGTGAG